MNSNSSDHGRKRELEDVLEDEPQSKRGAQGKAAHGGEQAGPSSDDGGRTIAPQMGDGEGTDREVGAGS
jgi:hypothetical protein